MLVKGERLGLGALQLAAQGEAANVTCCWLFSVRAMTPQVTPNADYVTSLS